MKTRLFIFCLLFLFAASDLSAQCAMCRATLENNVSDGQIGIAAGLNIGILYLFAAPYLVIGTIAFLWFKKSKAITEGDA
ncbi:MAG: hypothetical protein AAF363_21560 [Bacteroidota bacterium]